MKKTVVMYLVSHASGEMIEMLARNAVAQLAGVEVKRHLWKAVRHLDQLPDILSTLATTPGYVLHSISHSDIRDALEDGCRRLGIPCQFALEPLIGGLAEYSGAEVHYHNSSRDTFDEDYYRRVEAMKYTLAHDDGIASDDLDGADVIVVGVSRATKTPTCMYLASRGIKAANVPLVPGSPLPAGLVSARGPLIVGLTINPARLAVVRTARLRGLNDESNTEYADIDCLRQEVLEARRLFVRRAWPVIDVSQRSIEQTASMIIDMLRKRADGAS